MNSNGVTMYVVVGQIDEAEPPERGRVFITEGLAYAALGRLAVLHGTVGEMCVQEVEVVSADPAVPPVAMGRPEWLDRLLPPGWVAEQDEDQEVWIKDRDGRLIVRVSVGRLSSEQDLDLANYLAALVNVDRAGA